MHIYVYICDYRGDSAHYSHIIHTYREQQAMAAHNPTDMVKDTIKAKGIKEKHRATETL